MLIPIFFAVILIFSTVNYAFADRFSEWIEVWKKIEEQKAIEYQKNVLHFDYSKIQNPDPISKEPVKSTVAEKKHIQNERIITFKIIK